MSYNSRTMWNAKHSSWHEGNAKTQSLTCQQWRSTLWERLSAPNVCSEDHAISGILTPSISFTWFCSHTSWLIAHTAISTVCIFAVWTQCSVLWHVICDGNPVDLLRWRLKNSQQLKKKSYISNSVFLSSKSQVFLKKGLLMMPGNIVWFGSLGSFFWT